MMKISDDHTTSDPHRLRSILTQLVCCSCLPLIIIYLGWSLPHSAFAEVAGVAALCYAAQDDLAVGWECLSYSLS